MSSLPVPKRSKKSGWERNSSNQPLHRADIEVGMLGVKFLWWPPQGVECHPIRRVPETPTTQARKS